MYSSILIRYITLLVMSSTMMLPNFSSTQPQLKLFLFGLPHLHETGHQLTFPVYSYVLRILHHWHCFDVDQPLWWRCGGAWRIYSTEPRSSFTSLSAGVPDAPHGFNKRVYVT